MDNTNRLELVISVKDDGSIVVDQVKGKVESFEKAIVEAGSKGSAALASLKSRWLEFTVAAGSIYAITRGLNNFVNQAAEAEKIESRMAFQIEAVGIKYEKVKKIIDGYADSVMATTRFSDEATREGLGKMMQYTSDLEAAVKNLNLAMDMTIQNGFGLETNIRYVGMAMNGEVEMLGKLNPAFKDLNSKLDENASKADKSAYALNNLTKMFGGARQKDLDTYDGKLERLKKQWGAITTEIGTKLLPILDNYVWFIGHVTGLNEKASKATKDLAGDMTKLAEESKQVQSLKYTLGMKGVAEEAAEFRKDLKTMFQSTEALDDAFKTLGVTSQRSMTTTADWTLKALTIVQDNFNKGKASMIDYVNALKAADEILRKMTGEDPTKKRVDAMIELETKSREINREEEGWQKKQNALIDEWLAKIKEIEKTKIPIYADVSKFEAQVEESKRKVAAQGITIPVSAQSMGGGGSIIKTGETSWTDYVRGNIDFYTGGGKGLMDLTDIENKLKSIGDLDINIGIYGTGSSRKPIIEKIHEIIAEFGGLEKALSSMEAEINVAELSAEYKKLETKLNQVERILPDMSAMASKTGGSPYVGGPIVETVKQLMEEYTSQMKILQMKMDYQMLRTYGGSYQAGTRYVPQTGLYTLHEGERILTKNQISVAGSTNNFYIKSTNPRETADEILQVLKYDLHTELKDFLRKR